MGSLCLPRRNDVLQLGEEIWLVLAGNVDVTRQNDAQGEAGQLLVCGAVQRDQYDLLVRLRSVLVTFGEVGRDIFKEAVVQMHQQAQEDA